MTPERLAELDAVMAKASPTTWHLATGAIGVNPWISCGNWTRHDGEYQRGGCILNMVAHDNREDDAAAIVALHNAYTDLRAHIDAQAATIARMREALQVIVDDYQASPKHHPNDILIPIASFGLARAALSALAPIRATEILAAEANERARILSDAAIEAAREYLALCGHEPISDIFIEGAIKEAIKAADALRNEHGAGK